MKEKNGEHPLGDAGQIVLFILFLIVWVVDSFLLRKTTFLSDTIPLSIRAAVFCIALVTSVLLLKSAHIVVGKEKRPDDLLTSGAFRSVRHPLYLSVLLFYFGLFFSTLSISALILLVVIFIFYDYIAGYEEKLLLEKLGDRYLSYRKTTGKWIPFTGRKK